MTADITVQKQRLHFTRDPLALASLKEAITLFNTQARALAREIAALIEHDPIWTALDSTLRPVKGVADRTVATLLAELPEIGTLSKWPSPSASQGSPRSSTTVASDQTQGRSEAEEARTTL